MKESTKELLAITLMTFAYCGVFGALGVALVRAGHPVLGVLAVLPILLVRVKYDSPADKKPEAK